MKRNNSGQVLIFAVLSLIPLTILWIMFINICELVKERILLQNAADCAAQTSACIRARALNIIGVQNATLGTLLAIPEYCYWQQFNCNGGFHWGTVDNMAKLYEKTVKGLILAQENINKSYGGGWAFIKSRDVAKNMGASGIMPASELEDTFSLNLERNKGDIWYWKSFNCGATLYGHYHLGPVPDPMDIIKRKNTVRWYQQKKEFSKKKLRIIAYKKYKDTYWFPLCRKWLNLDNIELYAIAAARPYNKYGAMFPEKTEYWVDLDIKTKQIDILGHKFNNVPGSIDINFGGKAGLCAVESWNDGIGGLIKLAQGEPGGWDAQLVPVGQPFQH